MRKVLVTLFGTRKRETAVNQSIYNGFWYSDWEYRNIREFVTKEWDEAKKHITFIQSDEEKEFRQLMKVNHTILRHDKI